MNFSTSLPLLVLMALVSVACSAPGPATPVTPSQGALVLVADGTRYVGAYAMADQSMAVTIEGKSYKGHFVQRGLRPGAPASAVAAQQGGAPPGRWGSAFLFASSAQVLQCELDAGFPAVTGHCINAEGRRFRLMAVPRPSHAP